MTLSPHLSTINFQMGALYYGDNLDILRRYLKDETVDLVYLDPPFNSARNCSSFSNHLHNKSHFGRGVGRSGEFFPKLEGGMGR